MSIAVHPFAPYLAILGKGPRLSRHLTESEAEAATRMVLAGEVEPMQLGAFLCLMRLMGETPEELAGMVRAARATLAVPPGVEVDLDWPSYAGKRGRLPWFLLAALLLAGRGVRVFIHAQGEHTAGRLYTEPALAALGVAPARSLDEAAAQLAAGNFAFARLHEVSPRLSWLMTLKPILGVRSPIHTMVRELNPFDAPCEIIGVAHPPYRPLHQATVLRLGRPRAAVLKGDGGEAERRPEKPCDLALVGEGGAWEESWPPVLAAAALPADERLDPADLRRLWTGELRDETAQAAVVATAAVALYALGRAADRAAAEAMAASWWRERERGSLGRAA